jgi:hypothetical protein
VNETLLYPPKKRLIGRISCCPNQGVWMRLRYFEGVTMDMQCTLLTIVVIRKRRRLSWHRCCGCTRQMHSGRLVPETVRSWVSFAAWCRTVPHSNHTEQALFHSAFTRCSSNQTLGAEKPKQIRKRGRITYSFASLVMINESLNSMCLQNSKN